MRDFRELNKALDEYISKLRKNLIVAQKESGQYMLEDAKDRIEIPQEARNTSQFIQYENSIQIKTEEKDSEITTSVYSDLVINDGSKWDGVPVGAFLEWGTGPLGEESNDYEHGYDYTTNVPWDAHTALQWMETGNWGIQARPHLYPALMATKEIYKEKIEEAIKETWMK